ncbi:MAG: hypothetical protein IKC63_07915 [Clostridia bacterium]|nr:hypothetical protein [Clostridia bacterium]
MSATKFHRCHKVKIIIRKAHHDILFLSLLKSDATIILPLFFFVNLFFEKNMVFTEFPTKTLREQKAGKESRLPVF